MSGPISRHGPKYLRWALFEVALHACTHRFYRDRYERTEQRLGRQRAPKVAQIDFSRNITEAIWHMLTRNRLLRQVPVSSSRIDGSHWRCATGAASHDAQSPPPRAIER